jgi:tRNA dimethylallyltransferase
MLNVTNPKKVFSAGKYATLGRISIENILSREKFPIIVGGSGFYISVLLGEEKISDVSPNKNLRKKLADKSAIKLFKMLSKINPDRAKKMNDSDRKNPRRLIRAIEIASSSHLGVKLPSEERSNFETLRIGLILPKDELRARIRARLNSRLSGMISEVKKLHNNGLSWKRMNELGLEYRYLSKFLRGEITQTEMIRKLEIEIWRFSKRQMTWFRRDKKIKWFSPKNLKKIEKEIKKFLAS